MPVAYKYNRLSLLPIAGDDSRVNIDLSHQCGMFAAKTQTSLSRTPATWRDDNRLKTLLANKDAACPSGQRFGLGIWRLQVQIQILP